jgi:hypothetical protein
MRVELSAETTVPYTSFAEDIRNACSVLQEAPLSVLVRKTRSSLMLGP